MYRNYTDKKLTVENVKDIADILSYNRYNLDLDSSEMCETCGNYNIYMSGIYDVVIIEFESHCFGEELVFNISDDELVVKLKKWFNLK